MNTAIKEVLIRHVLPKVQTPGQYVGGELNMVCKNHSDVAGKLCLAFPDAYTIGMSHHGLQVLYSLMNARSDWLAERAFTPWPDMEEQLRHYQVPLYSLESYTPLGEFDVVGFSLQYEISSPNVLTMLDLAGIPVRGLQRTMADPLILAGGPCTQNPETMAEFVDCFVMGDGEPALPAICDLWLALRNQARENGGFLTGANGIRQREQALAELATRLPYAYVPRFYQPEYQNGRIVAHNRLRSEIPETIQPSVIQDLESIPLPTAPVVPYIECVHDRIAIEIMRGCPWQCRFCQSTVIKRPLRFRSVETIIKAALESYKKTGLNEISLLSLSTSDYPHFAELITRMKEVFNPLGVNISIPSLRVNEQLRSIAELIGNDRRSGLTLAPEVARDDMREQIRKKIKNDDLFEGCRVAFRNNYESVKLYFLCGLPGERPVDLEGIVEMAETIARIGKEEKGRFPKVTASVSNFVPKAHTPYQWNGMQRREYFHWAHKFLWQHRKIKSINIKCHSVETSLLEGVISRGDRRMCDAIELSWRRGARMDGWNEMLKPDRWWQALADSNIDVEKQLHEPYEVSQKLPWDHVNVKYGRDYLAKEQNRSVIQLAAMANVTTTSAAGN